MAFFALSAAVHPLKLLVMAARLASKSATESMDPATGNGWKGNPCLRQESCNNKEINAVRTGNAGEGLTHGVPHVPCAKITCSAAMTDLPVQCGLKPQNYVPCPDDQFPRPSCENRVCRDGWAVLVTNA